MALENKGARIMHAFVPHRHRESGEAAASETRGFVWNWGWVYDLVIWFFVRLVLGGSEQEFRRMIADLAQLQPGETVLDVGCGTGTLALVAKERVGTTGQVCGIDPGPKQ